MAGVGHEDVLVDTLGDLDAGDRGDGGAGVRIGALGRGVLEQDLDVRALDGRLDLVDVADLDRVLRDRVGGIGLVLRVGGEGAVVDQDVLLGEGAVGVVEDLAGEGAAVDGEGRLVVSRSGAPDAKLDVAVDNGAVLDGHLCALRVVVGGADVKGKVAGLGGDCGAVANGDVAVVVGEHVLAGARDVRAVERDVGQGEVAVVLNQHEDVVGAAGERAVGQGDGVALL